MAVSFLTAAQRDRYGRYPDVVMPNDLSRCFHLSDDDRATAWLLAHKILLPGVTTLERFVVSVRARVEARLYQLLTQGITQQQKDQLQCHLLLDPDEFGGRVGQNLSRGCATAAGQSRRSI
jgi:hypothetical protein